MIQQNEPTEKTTGQIINEEAERQILNRIKLIRYHLAKIEKHPEDMKYVIIASECILTEAKEIRQSAGTVLMWSGLL